MKKNTETPTPVSRRRMLVGGAAAAGAATLATVPALVTAPVAAATVSWEPKLLSEQQAATLERLCDLFLPRTSTAGALDAGVAQFIDLDLSLSGGEDQLALIGGLTWIDQRAQGLHGQPYTELDETRQTEILRSISDEHDSHPAELATGAAFFSSIKRRVLRAYFTSEKGRVEALGRKARVERETLQGCRHDDGNHGA